MGTGKENTKRTKVQRQRHRTNRRYRDKDIWQHSTHRGRKGNPKNETRTCYL